MSERPTPDLSIVETRVYRGANIWSYDKSIHLVVDLGCLEEYPTNTLPGFTDLLLEMLPGLREHTCSRRKRGGFVERLVEGTWLGHVAEHCALALEQVVGHDIRRGKTRGVKGQKGVYNVIFGYADEQVGLAAGRLAVRLVNHLVEADPEFEWEQELEDFIRRAQRTAFGPSTQAIIDEAVSRDIPWIRLNQHSLVQLGQGVHAQRIRATMTSETSAIAVDIASDKDLTTRLLGAAGLPVPKQETVSTEDAAVRAAERIGYPVVLKPLDGNHGRGVCLDVMDEADVREAYVVAREQSRRGVIVVESQITGKDYRCLIIDGRVAAIAERVPASVTGDGTSSVRELVDLANADPRRGVGHEKVLTRIKVDDAALERVRDQGFEIDDVPPEGQTVKLALTGNMSTGGISIDRTFEAHPENVEIAEEAARMVGLDIAGIDFICPDITEPVRETGGAHLRGQRRSRVPDAHAPDDRGAAVHRQARRRHALPAGGDLADPDRGRDRHQRQDHDLPDDQPRLQGHGPQGRHDLHRRRRDRRAAADPVRRLRAALGADGAAEPPRRLRGLRGRPRRHPARGPRLRAQRRRGRAQRAARPPRAARHRHRRAARRRQGRAGRGRAARRPRRPQRRRPAGARDAPALLGPGRVVLDGGARLRGPRHDRRALPPRRQGAGAQPLRARRDDRGQARPARDAAGLDPPPAGDLRRPGPDERPEHARRCGGGVRRRCPAARHPAGPAHVLHQLLPVPGSPQRGRGQRRQRDRRLLPQRARHEDARRLRRPRRRVAGVVARAGPALADRRHRHRRRPSRRGHARARRDRRPALRRRHRPRGRRPARP